MSLTKTGSPHIVQLFDNDTTLAENVAEYLLDGYMRNDRLLLAVRPEHWQAIAHELEEWGCHVPALVETGRIIVLDASATLETFVRDGLPHAEAFERAVGELVASLASQGPLNVYGEMVDVLAERGNIAGACALEQLWNALGDRVPFTLYCGYASARFDDSSASAALRAVCGVHTHVKVNIADPRGRALVAGLN